MHSGMKTYSCELCGKSFLDSLRLRMHLLSHSGKEIKLTPKPQPLAVITVELAVTVFKEKSIHCRRSVLPDFTAVRKFKRWLQIKWKVVIWNPTDNPRSLGLKCLICLDPCIENSTFLIYLVMPFIETRVFFNSLKYVLHNECNYVICVSKK